MLCLLNVIVGHQIVQEICALNWAGAYGRCRSLLRHPVPLFGSVSRPLRGTRRAVGHARYQRLRSYHHDHGGSVFKVRRPPEVVMCVVCPCLKVFKRTWWFNQWRSLIEFKVKCFVARLLVRVAAVCCCVWLCLAVDVWLCMVLFVLKINILGFEALTLY